MLTVLAVRLHTILMKKRKDIRRGFQQFHLFYLQLNELEKSNFFNRISHTNPHVVRLSKREMFRDQTSSNVFGDQTCWYWSQWSNDQRQIKLDKQTTMAHKLPSEPHSPARFRRFQSRQFLQRAVKLLPRSSSLKYWTEAMYVNKRIRAPNIFDTAVQTYRTNKQGLMVIGQTQF